MQKIIIIILLAGMTLGVYWRATDNDFINYDDDTYVTKNSHIQSGVSSQSIGWAMGATYAGNWHPLTWISHMLDYQLSGLNPRGHHLTNVLLHVVNAVLLFILFNRMTAALWRSAFIAALFALHPLHVESVAWVAERKDVLSTLFFMLTLLFYCIYTEKPDIKRYLAPLLTFLLGLMAKPMIVTLPCVLLLLDYWPLRRVNAEHISSGIPADYARAPFLRLILEKIPFFLLSGLSSIVTLYAQETGDAMSSLSEFPFKLRMLNAIDAVAMYLLRMVWPHKLAILYPRQFEIPEWKSALALFIVAGICLGVFLFKRRAPYLVTGWLWCLGTLVPVIGLVEVGSQSMADRYTYIPLIGIFVMIAWGVWEGMKLVPHGKIVSAVAATAAILVFSFITWQQLGYWRNSRTQFAHTLMNTTGNFIAHLKMGQALAKDGEYDDAIDHYNEALRIFPACEAAYMQAADVFLLQGETDSAIQSYVSVLKINPNHAGAHNMLGRALFIRKEPEKAMDHLETAVRIVPDNIQYRRTLEYVKSQSSQQK